MIDVFVDSSICACRHTSIPWRTDALLPLAQTISLLCFHLQTPAPEPAQVCSSQIPCLSPMAVLHTDLHIWEHGGTPLALLPPPLLPMAPAAGLRPSLIIPPAAFHSSSQTAQTSSALPPLLGPATSTSISIIVTSPPTFLACPDSAACLGSPLPDPVSQPCLLTPQHPKFQPSIRLSGGCSWNNLSTSHWQGGFK